MKKKFLAVIMSICMLFGVISFSSCSLTDALDMALELETLQSQVEDLKEENESLKSEVATLKFESVYPDHVIGGEDIIELLRVNVTVEGDGDAVVATDNAQVTINGGIYNGGQTSFGGAGNTAIWCASADAKIVINNGYFYINGLATNEEGIKDTGHIDLIYCSAGTIEINGGWFEGADSDVWLLNCKDTAYNNGTARIVVTGGTFVNFDPLNCLTESVKDENGILIPVSYVAEGYTVVAEEVNGKTLYSVIPASETPETSVSTEEIPVL